MKYDINYSLYLVTDRKILGERELFSSVEKAILGGVTLIQLREKDISSLEFYNIAAKLKTVTDRYKTPLIINDRIDIALAVDATGVHVGQSDIPCNIVRKVVGEDKIVGISVSNFEEALKAEKDGANYLGVGAVFPTGTKNDAKSVSLETLKTIKKSVSIPVVAIGGINEKNCKQLIETDIDGIAVISAILGKNEIKDAANCLLHWKTGKKALT